MTILKFCLGRGGGGVGDRSPNSELASPSTALDDDGWGSGLTGNFTLVELYSDDGVSSSSCSSPSVVKYFITAIARIPSGSVRSFHSVQLNSTQGWNTSFRGCGGGRTAPKVLVFKLGPSQLGRPPRPDLTNRYALHNIPLTN